MPLEGVPPQARGPWAPAMAALSLLGKGHLGQGVVSANWLAHGGRRETGERQATPDGEVAGLIRELIEESCLGSL